jgi:hypothetical protein
MYSEAKNNLKTTIESNNQNMEKIKYMETKL